MTERTGAPRRNALDVIARITQGRPARPPGPRCEMCGEPITEEHQHCVNVEQRTLLCSCRPCYLLFTAEGAAIKFRAVPDRYLRFPDFELGPGIWDALEIPVGLVFVFHNSTMGRVAAFYPGPAGATESMLPLDAWASVVAANPDLSALRPDVEALLLRARPDDSAYDCFLVPVDSCYELIGRLRQGWRGFDGGSEARGQIEDYFAEVARRSKVAPSTRAEVAP